MSFAAAFHVKEKEKSPYRTQNRDYVKTTTRCIVTFDPVGSLQRDVDIDLGLSFDSGITNHGILIATSSNNTNIHFTYGAEKT